MKSLSIALLTGIAALMNCAYAANYDCTIVLFSSSGPSPIGQIKLEGNTGVVQKVVLNQEKDAIGCVATKPTTPQDKTFIACAFFEAGSDGAFTRDRRTGLPLALKRSRSTRQVSSAPMSFASDGSELVGLMLPMTGQIYAAACALRK